MNNYKIIKKAYKIDFYKIKEGYAAIAKWCYAKTRNKARNILYNEVRYDDWFLKWEDEPINYLTIPIKRAKEYDLVEFEEKEVQRNQIDRIIAERNRNKEFDDILSDDNIKYCYIIKRGLFYRPNSCGYTELYYAAGVYDKEDAIDKGKSCNELRLEPINIKQHNEGIKELIKKLKNNLI